MELVPYGTVEEHNPRIVPGVRERVLIEGWRPYLFHPAGIIPSHKAIYPRGDLHGSSIAKLHVIPEPEHSPIIIASPASQA